VGDFLARMEAETGFTRAECEHLLNAVGGDPETAWPTIMRASIGYRRFLASHPLTCQAPDPVAKINGQPVRCELHRGHTGSHLMTGNTGAWRWSDAPAGDDARGAG
jgi:hypothetical protein